MEGELLSLLGDILRKEELEVSEVEVATGKELLVKIPEEIRISFSQKPKRGMPVTLGDLLNNKEDISPALCLVLRCLGPDLSASVRKLSSHLIEVVFKGVPLRIKSCLQITQDKIEEALGNGYSSPEELQELNKSLF